MGIEQAVAWISLAALLGILLGFGGARVLDRFRLSKVQARVAEITKQAEENAKTIRQRAELDAKDELFKKREEFNREMEQARNELREHERRLEKREDGLEQKQQVLAKKEKSLDNNQRKLSERKNELEKRHEELDAVLVKQQQTLHEISHLSREQAEQMLLERLDRQLAGEGAGRIQKHEEMLKATCEEKARAVLATAIHRYAAEHTADTTVSTVDIPSDDMKGRIIGREGRHLRTFEKATGVDVIVDDTPGGVIVSAFDNIRREVARISLSKLIQDGRIHPTRIEEVVKETQEEMERNIMEIGKQAVMEANIGQLHEKLIHLLGRLKFRT